jgi:hypothetical protein
MSNNILEKFKINTNINTLWDYFFMLLIYELYASLHFFWASFFIPLYEFQFLVLWLRFARLHSFCFRLDRVRRSFVIQGWVILANSSIEYSKDLSNIISDICHRNTKSTIWIGDLNLPVEKGRHTETKKQNRGNVKQHTGKVQN